MVSITRSASLKGKLMQSLHRPQHQSLKWTWRMTEQKILYRDINWNPEDKMNITGLHRIWIQNATHKMHSKIQTGTVLAMIPTSVSTLKPTDNRIRQMIRHPLKSYNNKTQKWSIIRWNHTINCFDEDKLNWAALISDIHNTTTRTDCLTTDRATNQQNYSTLKTLRRLD